MLAIISSLFNHSCYPNVVHFSYGNKMVFTAIRPVKKGQHVFVIYHKDLIMKSTDDRQKWLQETFKFSCECSKCVPKHLQNIDSMTRAMHQDQCILKIFDEVSNAEHSIQIENFFQFMWKYGHLSYTEPCFNVYFVLLDCLNRDYSGKKQIFSRMADLRTSYKLYFYMWMIQVTKFKNSKMFLKKIYVNQMK